MGKHEEHDALAERMFGAIMAGDIDTVLACYSDDAVMRINVAPGDMGPADIAGMVQMVSEKIPDFTYSDIRRVTTDDGFVEQHLVTGTGLTGQPFSFEVCAVAKVVDGRVAVLEEYADSAAMAPMGLF
ncbi:unannotated protein [freshwater metagenome]|uniref:Unannotated protein n=1 Tax=freshwater metagenome TaxID=449393 RepID=A0A6J7I9H4_9ZZZZ|nr:hypothetical protein [Actinomycetota bacterium]